MKTYRVAFTEVIQGEMVKEAVVAASKLEALMWIVNTYKVHIVHSVERVKE